MARSTRGARTGERLDSDSRRSHVSHRWRFPDPRLAALCLAMPAMCWAIGCGTMRSIDPDAGPIELADDEGLVVLHVITELPITSVKLVGYELNEEIPPGTTVRLIAATRGSYMFDSFTRRLWGSTFRWRIHRDGHRVRFDVRSGQINYPGAVLIGKYDQRIGESTYVRLRIANRTSMIAADLERRYPGLQARYPLRYAAGKDRFLEALAEARSGGAAVEDSDGSAQ